jgi:hypothetical protein
MLRYGNGQGQFADSIVGAGYGYYSITAADFNGDTWIDLAMSSPPYDMAVMLNNGAGLFNAPVFFSAGIYPYWISSADFNADGYIDVATANNLNDKVMVFLNNGLANFTLVDSVVVGDYPVCLAIADLNGDSIADIAVANTNSSSVSILQGDGTGHFAIASTLTPDAYPVSIISDDFNGDSKNDLAIVTTLNNNDTGHVEVYINCFTAGIEEEQLETVNISQNPSDGFISLIVSNTDRITKMDVTNFSGKNIFHADHFLKNIDLRNESKGVYLLRIFDGNKWYIRKLIVI